MINTTIQISNALMLYQSVMLILYYFKKIDSSLLSWTIIINFFIIFVLFFCDCNLPPDLIIGVLLIKIIFLCILLPIVEFSLINYLIGLNVLIIYYCVTDINTVYSCNVKFNCLILSLLVSSIIYIGKIYI